MNAASKHSIIGRFFAFIGIVIVVIVAVFALTNAYVVVSQRSRIVSDQEAAASNANAILVLGASVLPDGTPSGILQDRLNAAIRLYEEGAAPKIIMSGDGGDASYNEPGAMKMYAIAQGVPSEDIFCDRAGFNTYDSMYRAKHVFGVQNLIVVTQSYHLTRALFSANHLGMSAVGVASDAGVYTNQTEYDLREIPARTKDFFQVLINKPSTTTSDAPVSLNQSGDVTNKWAS